jgi:hypothetical protein
MSAVRVRHRPPAFAREASEGCRAEARRAKAGGCCRELRLGKPLAKAISKSLLCEGPARRRFKVFLERKRLGLIGKSNVSLNLPWRIFGCMQDFAGIVLPQTSPQIGGDTDIIATIMFQTSENVHVGHANTNGLPSRNSRQHPPAFALRAPARSPSLASRAKPGSEASMPRSAQDKSPFLWRYLGVAATPRWANARLTI